MKARHYIFGLVACLALSLSTFAQNTLQVSDVRIQPDRSIMLPIQMTNSQPIVAVQFNISVPDGASLWTDSPTLTERATNHQSVMSYVGDTTYSVMVFSPSNEAFLGHHGQLISIGLTIGSNFVEGASYDIKLSNVVLALRDGSNVMTGWTDGKITVENTPDLFIHDVQTNRTEYMPGEQITVSWVTENIGAFALMSGWTANISIVNSANDERYIGSLHKALTAAGFAAGATVAQTVVLEMPKVLGIDGEAYVRVQIDADNESGETWEHTANNTAVCANAVSIGKKMFADIPDRIEESDHTEYIYIYRSGSTVQEDSVSIRVGDTRLSLQSPALFVPYSSSAYVPMVVTANGIVDADSLTTLHIESAEYGVINRTIRIIDDAMPAVHIHCDSTEVTEGSVVDFIISVDQAPSVNMTFSVLCSASDRFAYPQTVKLPAGETSVVMRVKALDNTVVDPHIDAVFELLNVHYSTARMTIKLWDNDMPEFTMEISPLSVTESSGIQAATGYLTRTTRFDREVTFRLQDDSNGRLIYSSYDVTLPKGSHAGRFSIGIVDDQDVNGDTTFHVTAAVYMPGCWCTDTTSAGTCTRAITVIDDDGPALRLSANSSMLLEGDEDGVALTITRNTTPEGVLAVNLSADNETGLTFSHTVTIPDGETSVTIPVHAQSNDISGDGRTIAFMAQADSFAMGTTWLILTDQTLPDAQIGAFTIDTTAAVADTEPVTVSVSVLNRGAAALPEGTLVKVYISGQDLPLVTMQTTQDLLPKQQAVLPCTFKLPKKPGEYYLYATVNESRHVEELIYTNNTSESLTVHSVSPFAATLQPGKTMYVPGETIHIEGQLITSNAGGKQIEVYARNYDHRFAKTMTTNAEGQFTMDFTPITGQCGAFGFGVCELGAEDDAVLTTVTVLGLQESDYTTCYPTVGYVYDGEIWLKNLSDSALSGLTAHIAPEHGLSNIASLVCDTITLAGNESKALPFHLLTNAASTTSDWEQMPIVFTSAEGLQTAGTIYYFARTAHGQLVVDLEDGALNATVTQGTTRDMTLTIRNYGAGETGTISFALPNFITTVTPGQMSSLQPEEIATAILRITPEEDMMLNVPVTGQFGINCSNGAGVAVPFGITVVSGNMGTLNVDVCDEYTYYTPEAPHVSGAMVVVRQPQTEVIAAEGITDSTGHYSVELPEGYYYVDVYEERHESKRVSVLVNPDRETLKTVNIATSLVSVDWKVVETEVEDEYEIVSTVVYETNVPAPVIVFTMPEQILIELMADCEQRIYYAKAVNKGLVRADNVTITLPKDSDLLMELLAYKQPFSLASQDSVLIPIRVTKLGDACREGSGGGGDSGTGGGGGDSGTGGGGGDSGSGGGGGDSGSGGGGGDSGSGGGGGDSGSGGGGGGSGSGGGGGDSGSGGGGGGSGSGGGGGGSGSGGGGGDSGSGGGGGSGSGGGGGDSGSGGGGGGSGSGGSGGGSGSGGGGGGSGSGGDGGGGGGEPDTFTKDCIIYTCTRWSVKCGDDLMWYRECAGTAKERCADWPASYYNMPGNDGPSGCHVGTDDVPPAQPYELKNTFSMYSEDCDSCVSPFKNYFQECAWDLVTTFVPIMGTVDKFIKCHKAAVTSYDKGPLNSDTWDCVSSFIPIVNNVLTVHNMVKHCVGASLDPCGGVTFDGKPSGKLGGDGGLSSGGWSPNNFAGLFAAPSRRAPGVGDEQEAQPNDYSKYPSNIQSYLNKTEYAWRAGYAQYGIGLELFGDSAFMLMDSLESQALYDYLVLHGADDGIMTVKPDSVTPEQMTRFAQRWNNTLNGDTTDGNYIHNEVIGYYLDIIVTCNNAAHQLGYFDLSQLVEGEVTKLLNDFQEAPDGSICASVSLQFTQKAVFARQAFRGTLTVGNGDAALTMDSVRLTLRVVNQTTGAVATEHEFQINVESLSGFEGQLNLEDGWALAPSTTGIATILFIPTKYAAPTTSINYSFGGELSYKDPNSGLTVTRTLMPQILTVKPSPNLQLNYFMQRDILGDDPLTALTTEPMEEAEFALLIHNIGNGAANDMRIKTEQPKIVDNDKGLNVDFTLTRTMHNGQSAAFALDGSVTNELGTIAAHSTDYVQWFLTSTLIGHFTNYNVQATHLTSYGNPDLSLLDTVTIHELIRSIDMPQGCIGWLCNDIPDAHDQPDMLYGADGSVTDVLPISEAQLTATDIDEYMLTVTAPTGWIYGHVLDQTAGMQNLVRVVRVSDDKEISLRNCWQTHVTLRDGRKPLYENRIHLVDSVSNGTESYMLYFSDRPATQLMIDRFEGVPAEPIDTALAGVVVIFNKPLAPISFTYEDLRLTRGGQQLDMSQVTVQQITETAHFINLRSVTAENGFYVLEINMTNVVDPEGFNGINNGNMVYWTQGSEDITTDIEVTTDRQSSVYKFLQDGILFIRHGNQLYNAQGQRVK